MLLSSIGELFWLNAGLDIFVQMISLENDFLDLGKFLVWHVNAQFCEVIREVFFSWAYIYLRWVYSVQDLCIAKTFNWGSTVKFDFTISIVFNIIKFWMLAKFCQDKWNCALLLVKIHSHVLICISLANRFLDLFITLE